MPSTTSSRPLSSTSLPNNAYVIALAALPASATYAAATSLPSNAIHLFHHSAPSTIALSLPGHADGISALTTAQNLVGAGESLISCGKDGQLKSWDLRTGGVAIQMKAGKRVSLMSCDTTPDGMLAAAGTALQGEDASILYWDPRNPAAPLRRHTSAHSDDITAVCFSPSSTTTASNAQILLSASTDGLLCTSDPYTDDEDDAQLGVRNWGCSISKAGWIDAHNTNINENPRVWAVSDMETVSFWSEELDPIRDVDRDALAQLDPTLPWVTDYIVDCHTSSSGSFYIFAGSNEGDVALLSPHEDGKRWVLEQTYTKNHSEIVRCALWDERNGILLTGGEDARINVWSSPSIASDSSGSSADASMEVHSLTRKRIVTMGNQNSPKRMRTD